MGTTVCQGESAASWGIAETLRSPSRLLTNIPSHVGIRDIPRSSHKDTVRVEGMGEGHLPFPLSKVVALQGARGCTDGANQNSRVAQSRGSLSRGGIPGKWGCTWQGQEGMFLGSAPDSFGFELCPVWVKGQHGPRNRNGQNTWRKRPPIMSVKLKEGIGSGGTGLCSKGQNMGNKEQVS